MKDELNIFEKEWTEYFGWVYPKGCPDFQKQQIRGAFFAGFLSAFGLSTEVASQMKDEDAVKFLKSIQVCCVDEAKKYFKGEEKTGFESDESEYLQ